MARDPSGVARRHLRTLFDAGAATGLTDGQLLERFATRRGEAAELAFAALVERHGPMVLRACRGIIREDHEAMDAFQATFLVLARKGGSLWVRDSLGPWLHRVACRAASRAKAGAARRRALELRLAERQGGRTDDGDRDERAAVLHEEVDRLPDRYRVPIVLCDLEGRTCEEVARHLGCPIGTIGSRLVRGRERLRDRLRRRGLAPDAGVPATALSPDVLMMIPPALVDSTTAAVFRFVAARAVAGGSAALLAQGVLSSMAIVRWIKVAAAVLALGATTSGVALLAQKGPSGDKPGPEENAEAARAADVPVAVVKPGKLKGTVSERGSLESSRSEDVRSKVQGQATLLSILPEGTQVKKGELVGELDSSKFKNDLANQKIAVQGAEASYQDAMLARQLAEIAVNEYREGIYKQAFQTAKGEVAMADSALKLAESRLERTERAHKRMKGMLAKRAAGTPAELVTELDMDNRQEATLVELQRQRFSLEQAQTRLQVLQGYTYSKTIKVLEHEMKKQLGDELAKKATWKLEKAKEAQLETQVENCKLYAPIDGTLIYRFIENEMGAGATVRERQMIFRVSDRSRMLMEAKVPETMLDRIKPGQRARVEVDAFPQLTVGGVVERVSSQPEPMSPSSGSDTKSYRIEIALENPPPDLREGMTSLAEIFIDELDNVLSVPVKALLHVNGEPRVAVKTPDGGFDWREVTLGVSTDTLAEVRRGIKSGESIALDPRALKREEETPEKPGTPTRPATGSSPSR